MKCEVLGQISMSLQPIYSHKQSTLLFVRHILHFYQVSFKEMVQKIHQVMKNREDTVCASLFNLMATFWTSTI